MGMYDELQCEYPLPDGFDPQGVVFQTKDTPEQYLARYVLTADGTLQEFETGTQVPYHGSLTFYAGNVCASGPHGVATSDDTPPWWAEYCALFDRGKLLKLEGAKRLDTTSKHLTRAEFNAKHRRPID